MDSFNTAFKVGNAGLTWNAIMLALGILVAVVVSEILVKKRGLYKDLALDACIVGIPAGLIGGRLFAAISGKIPFAHFFNLSVGGLNLPGALLLAGIGIAIYARIKKLSLSEVFDALTPGAFFGMAVGRWSDFFLCDGLGPVAGAGVPKFFPLVTFTNAYFRDGRTVAYAVFFLDFLICAALGVTALLLLKKKNKGTAARVTILVYLFAEFILEWLRDGSTRQIVFGEVRFNQIVLLVMLLFFIGLTLYRAKRQGEKAAEEAVEAENAESEEKAGEEQGTPESGEKAEGAAETPEPAEEPEETEPAEEPEDPEPAEKSEPAEEPEEASAEAEPTDA